MAAALAGCGSGARACSCLLLPGAGWALRAAQCPPCRMPAVFAGRGLSVTVVWHKTEGVLRKSAESFKVRHRFADKKNVLLT